MKHIASLALIALLATTASAATIKWGASGAAYYGDTLLKNDASTAYLVYLGENKSDWTSYNFKTDFEDSRLQSKAMSALGAAGSNNQFKVTEGSAIGGIDSLEALFADKKSSFGILYTTTQGGKDYYYLGQVFTFDSTNTSAYNGTTQTFTATSTSAPGKTTTWTPVPEPSTAALALAGLALLLKRRKA